MTQEEFAKHFKLGQHAQLSQRDVAQGRAERKTFDAMAPLQLPDYGMLAFYAFVCLFACLFVCLCACIVCILMACVYSGFVAARQRYVCP